MYSPSRCQYIFVSTEPNVQETNESMYLGVFVYNSVIHIFDLANASFTNVTNRENTDPNTPKRANLSKGPRKKPDVSLFPPEIK